MLNLLLSATRSSLSDGSYSIWRLLLGLAITTILLVGFYLFFKGGFHPNARLSKHLRIVERVGLTPESSLLLVKIGSRLYAMSATKQEIKILCEVTDIEPEVPEVLENATFGKRLAHNLLLQAGFKPKGTVAARPNMPLEPAPQHVATAKQTIEAPPAMSFAQALQMAQETTTVDAPIVNPTPRSKQTVDSGYLYLPETELHAETQPLPSQNHRPVRPTVSQEVAPPPSRGKIDAALSALDQADEAPSLDYDAVIQSMKQLGKVRETPKNISPDGSTPQGSTPSGGGGSTPSGGVTPVAPRAAAATYAAARQSPRKAAAIQDEQVAFAEAAEILSQLQSHRKVKPDPDALVNHAPFPDDDAPRNATRPADPDESRNGTRAAETTIRTQTRASYARPVVEPPYSDETDAALFEEIAQVEQQERAENQAKPVSKRRAERDAVAQKLGDKPTVKAASSDAMDDMLERVQKRNSRYHGRGKKEE